MPEVSPVSLTLSRDEALVLFDYLFRFDRSDSLAIEDQAEQRVLWNLQARLEKILAEPFRDDYADLIRAARDRVRDPVE